MPFAATNDQLVPEFLPIEGQQLVRQTSSTHGTDGYITTDPDQIAKMQERLDAKLRNAVSNFNTPIGTIQKILTQIHTQ